LGEQIHPSEKMRLIGDGMLKLRIADCGLRITCPAVAAILSVLILIFPQICRPESLASKNNKGNRLFNQGKYEDAEKAYLAAQADSPGKPEVLYNLGNSLIKQKKYREGVQSLGQSISKGDNGIKEKGWYNTGNALFLSGNYRDSADAYIQALKLDPADTDAKHNLELALTKLKQQEQQKQQNSKDSRENKSSGSQKSQPQQQSKDEKNSGKENPGNEQAVPPREGSLTKEQALQLLDAVKNQEMKEQRKLLEGRAKEKANGRDW
jgi:Ca-activated chloride channel homolog